MLSIVLTIDSTGTYVASFDANAGWQSLASIGEACFVPGAPIAVFNQPTGTNTALTIDRDGVLNAVSFDAQGVPSSPTTYGSASFVPGSPIAVVADGSTYSAAIVDGEGVLNSFVWSASSDRTAPTPPAMRRACPPRPSPP